MEHPEWQEFEKLFETVKRNELADPLEYILANTRSTLVHQVIQSIPQLKKLAGRELIESLRSREFDVGYLDMRITANIAWYFVDTAEAIPGRKTHTKSMGLPLLILYEHGAKQFDENREVINEFFEEYQRKNSPGYTFYDSPENIRNVLETKQGAPIADGLNMLRLRPDHVLQTGKYTYGGEIVNSKEQANKIIQQEISGLLGEIARKTSRHKAAILLQDMRTLCHKMANYDSDHHCDPALGDWLQPLMGFKHLAEDITEYSAQVGIELQD